jgi:hypothetical protein
LEIKKKLNVVVVDVINIPLLFVNCNLFVVVFLIANVNDYVMM